MTLCLRLSLDNWNSRVDLHCGSHLQVGINWKHGGFVQIENTKYRFKWPGGDLQDFPPWNAFCLTIDKINKSLSVVVNGKNAPIQSVLSVDSNQQISCPILSFTGLIGKVTDLNLWNIPLNASDVLDYSNGCINGLFLREEPKLVYWPQMSYALNGPVPALIDKKELCFSNFLTFSCFGWKD